jgi:hypothetical protein
VGRTSRYAKNVLRWTGFVTRTEILEIANQLTERKGEKVLNMQTLYRLVLQDICKRERFWWRRVQVSFTLAVGVSIYDLTTIVTVPANQLLEIALDEITKFTLILTPNPLQVVELTPVFDPETLIEMQNNTANQQPARYTMDANDYKKLRVDPPDLAYSAYIIGRGMPNPASDSITDTVPLIPPWGHNTIVAGLVWRIFKWQYGSKNDKTLDAMAEYEQALQDLMQRKQFDPNYRLQMNLTEDAVRST